jgi:hypothetical protein
MAGTWLDNVGIAAMAGAAAPATPAASHTAATRCPRFTPRKPKFLETRMSFNHLYLCKD